MNKAVEMHYTAQEVATLLRKSSRYVKDKIKQGEFGADVFFMGGDYIIAASAVNAFLEKYRFWTPGIKARTQGEFRRKFQIRQESDGQIATDG